MTVRSLALCFAGMFGAMTSHAAADLPDGQGKVLVQTFCSSCHSTSLITMSSGYTQGDWKTLISTMFNFSALPEQEEEITAYLAEHFPPHKNLAPTLVPGDVDIAIEEWVMPTLGQRTRDPAEAPDGSIWWAGQYSNRIGRIDPETGEVTEFTLPPNTNPHTVTFN